MGRYPVNKYRRYPWTMKTISLADKYYLNNLGIYPEVADKFYTTPWKKRWKVRY